MARRYVRDKIGRFASHGGGGGSFGGVGKIGKSAKNVKARKAYKSASSKVRKADRDFKTADRKSSAARGAYTRSAGKGPAKAQQAAGKWHASMVKREQAARKIGGSKSGLTRVTNRLTGKGAAKAKRGAVNPNKLASSKKYATARKARKGSAVRKDAVASAKIRRGERRAKAEIRKGAKARSSYKPKQEAKQAKERILKKTKAKRMEQGVFKTPKGKMSKTKTTAVSKSYYKQLSGNARKNMRVGEARRAGSPTLLPKAKHDSARGVKKRRGAKVYDNTTNTFIKIKTKKRDLKRKYKYGYS